MKITTNDLLATSAIGLGVGQMLIHMIHVYNTDDVSSYSFKSVFIGITASSLWMLYQFRKGSNYSAVYSSAGLVAQLYILQRLLSKAKEETKKETHSKM